MIFFLFFLFFFCMNLNYFFLCRRTCPPSFYKCFLVSYNHLTRMSAPLSKQISIKKLSRDGGYLLCMESKFAFLAGFTIIDKKLCVEYNEQVTNGIIINRCKINIIETKTNVSDYKDIKIMKKNDENIHSITSKDNNDIISDSNIVSIRSICKDINDINAYEHNIKYNEIIVIKIHIILMLLLLYLLILMKHNKEPHKMLVKLQD
eukprot:370480_1